MKTINKEQHLPKMHSISEKEFLSFKEALAYLDVSKSFLYKLTSRRQIQFFKPNGGKIYFKKSVLNEWMQRNEYKTGQDLRERINESIKNWKNER